MPKKQPEKRIARSGAAASRPPSGGNATPVVLVGTYRPEQMARWILPQGLYNYPVKNRDTAIIEAAPRVSELWLYAGKAAKRRFAAKLERRVTASELDAIGYPKGMGRHHGKEYLLFRVAEIDDSSAAKDAKDSKCVDHRDTKTQREGTCSVAPALEPASGNSAPLRLCIGKNASAGGASRPGEPRILVRLEDFEHDKAELKAKLSKLFGTAKAGKAPAPEKPFTYLDCLPDDLLEDWCGNLRVCEAAEQLTFWQGIDEGGPALRLKIDKLLDKSVEEQTKLASEESEVFASVVLAKNPRLHGWVAPSGIHCFFSKRTGALFSGDSLEWLKSLPNCCVDMVFADPPYGIGKADWDVFPDEAAYLSWCDKWVGEVARILTPHGSCYICGFSEILADVKFRVARHFKTCRWLVWHYRNKANLGMDWGRSHESILHFRKSSTVALHVDDVRIPYGAHTLKYPARTQAETSAFAKSASGKKDAWTPNPLGAKPKDVFDIPTTCNGMGEKTPHPTQKPEELLRKLVLASSNPGDWVLDPFSGSGTTLVVSEQLGRNWLGCDLSSEYNGWAKRRLINVPSRPISDWIALDRETATRRDSIR